MNESLAEALHHSRHRCLGRRLKPFTLRHAFSLALAENPFFTGDDRDIELPDLRQAVEICCRPGDYFISGHRPNPIGRDLWRLRTSRMAKKHYYRELGAFHIYLNDYCNTPQVWIKEGGKPLKVDWIFSMAVGLMMDLGMSEDEAWSVSPGKGQWLLLAAAERNPFGSAADIVTEDDLEVMSKLDEIPDDPEAVKAMWNGG